MTKTDLAEKIYETLNCQKKEAIELVDLTLEVLKEVIATEGYVKISGFGNFTVRQGEIRRCRRCEIQVPKERAPALFVCETELHDSFFRMSWSRRPSDLRVRGPGLMV